MLAACSLGQGVGEATGEVHLPDCAVENTAYSLEPSFFSADYVSDPRTRVPGGAERTVVLRMQRGGYRESLSDGLTILLRDITEIQPLLPMSIEISRDEGAMALMTLYLNETCESGFPREFWTVPGVLQGVSGTLTLDSVHSPSAPIAGGTGEFSGTFTGVRFVDVGAPDTRFAVLDGWFAFPYQRGRPAQRFP